MAAGPRSRSRSRGRGSSQAKWAGSVRTRLGSTGSGARGGGRMAGVPPEKRL